MKKVYYNIRNSANQIVHCSKTQVPTFSHEVTATGHAERYIEMKKLIDVSIEVVEDPTKQVLIVGIPQTNQRQWAI